MASELGQALEIVGRAAAWHGGRVAMVGILPTLRPGDLELAALSDAPRYRALTPVGRLLARPRWPRSARPPRAGGPGRDRPFGP